MKSIHQCPECGHKLVEREANVPENLLLREIPSVWDRFVCLNCRTTYKRSEIERTGEIVEWLQ